MTVIHYREIICDGFNHGEIVDEHHSFDLRHFADACGQSPEAAAWLDSAAAQQHLAAMGR